jgi:GNAT superfamily N-acetyltransferase
MSCAALAYRPDPCAPSATDLTVRPLEPGEAGPVLDVFDGLSTRSRHSRFLAPKPRLTGSDLRQLTAVDPLHHVALVALSPHDGRTVGIARFVRDDDDPGAAEVAVAVVDAWQGQGVGSRLAADLAIRALEVGITRFNALMLPENEAAARLMHHTAGEVERTGLDSSGAEFVITLAPARPSRRHRLKGV